MPIALAPPPQALSKHGPISALMLLAVCASWQLIFTNNARADLIESLEVRALEQVCGDDTASFEMKINTLLKSGWEVIPNSEWQSARLVLARASLLVYSMEELKTNSPAQTAVMVDQMASQIEDFREPNKYAVLSYKGFKDSLVGIGFRFGEPESGDVYKMVQICTLATWNSIEIVRLMMRDKFWQEDMDRKALRPSYFSEMIINDVGDNIIKQIRANSIQEADFEIFFGKSSNMISGVIFSSVTLN